MKAKYFSIAAGLLLMALSSCNDFLDKTPDTRVYLVNVEQLRQLMVDGYMGVNIAQTGEISSDNVVDNNAPPTLKSGMRYNLKAYSLAMVPSPCVMPCCKRLPSLKRLVRMPMAN